MCSYFSCKIIFEHQREREKLIPPIEVKSKFCSGFLSFRIVDIIEVMKETLEKHTIKFRTAKKVHFSTTVNNKYILFRKYGSKTMYAIYG